MDLLRLLCEAGCAQRLERRVAVAHAEPQRTHQLAVVARRIGIGAAALAEDVLELLLHERPHGIELRGQRRPRSEEQTSELQSLMRISYAVFCLKKQNQNTI